MATKQDQNSPGTGQETLVLEKEKLKIPRDYVVILHNDDYTTQEFVVHILMQFFGKDQASAFRLMIKIHTEGKAQVGSFTKDMAETKVAFVTAYCRDNGMPLLLTSEPLEH